MKNESFARCGNCFKLGLRNIYHTAGMFE